MQNNDHQPDSIDSSTEDNTIPTTPLNKPMEDADSPTEPVHTTVTDHDSPTEPVDRTPVNGKTPINSQMSNNIHLTGPTPAFGANTPRYTLFSRKSWFWPVSILMFLIIAGLILLTVLQGHGIETHNGMISIGTPAHPDTSDAKHSFQVGDHAIIIIKGHSSNVNVHTGATGTVLVQTKTSGSQYGQNLNGTRILYNESHPDLSTDRITIGADPIFNNVDYDLTVPSTASVQVQVSSGSVAIDGISGVTIYTGSGSLNVEDVHGPVNISTDSGDITARNIKGTMILAASSGSIRANDLNGSLKATTHSGDLVIHSSAISGLSTLQTNNGSVRIDSSLDPHGTYHLTTYSGDVDLSIPASSAFRLQTTLGSGSLHNDFANNTTGTTPQATIVINIGSGSATINKLP